MRVLFLLLLSGSAAGLQFGSAAALQPAGTSRKGAPPLHSSSRHPVLVAAARKPAGVPAAAENPARPLQLTAFVFVLGLSLVTLTPAKAVTDRMGTEAGMRLLTLLTTGSAAAEIGLSPLVGSLTDSVGRKPVLLVTCFSVFAVNLATAVWPTVPLIALSKLVSSLVVGFFFLAAGAILADRLRDDPAKLAAASGSLFAVVNGGFGVGIAASELLPSGLRWRYGISSLISLLGFGMAARVRESLSDEDRLPFEVRSFNPFAFTRLFFMSRAMSLLALLSVLTLLPIFMGDTLQVFALTQWQLTMPQVSQLFTGVAVSGVIANVVGGRLIKALGLQLFTAIATMSTMLFWVGFSSGRVRVAVACAAVGLLGPARTLGATTVMTTEGARLGVPQGQLSGDRANMMAWLKVLGPLGYGTLYVRGVQAGVPTAPFIANVGLTFASLVLGFYALSAAASAAKES